MDSFSVQLRHARVNMHSLTVSSLPVSTVHVPLFALAVVAVTVGALHDASGSAGLAVTVAVAGLGLRLRVRFRFTPSQVNVQDDHQCEDEGESGALHLWLISTMPFFGQSIERVR